MGEPDSEDPECLLLSKLPGQEVTGSIWFCSVRTGDEEEEDGGDPWNMAGGTLRFSLGGTGGNNPPASDKDKLRLGFLLSAWLGLRLGVLSLRSEVNLSSVGGVSPEVKPSKTVKQMDSWESLLGGGGAGSGVGQKWMGAVLRRLKTVLGLGTGFTTGLLLSQLVSMAARFGAELFLNASKLTGPVDWQSDATL